jgi:hypothetical protein
MIYLRDHLRMIGKCSHLLFAYCTACRVKNRVRTCIIESMILGDEADGTVLFGLWVY